MKDLIIKIGISAYLILFAYILVFQSFNVENLETQIFFLLSPFVLIAGFRNFKMNRK